MIKNIAFLCIIFISFVAYSQQNCELLKEDENCYKACITMNQESIHHQGSYESQRHLSDAIELCPTLSNAYFEKSVAFLKRGLFLEWKELMDIAVEINPEQHLSYRGWCQFFFLGNYIQASEDLTKLSELKGEKFIGVGQNGEYDLRILIALSHRFNGNTDVAIKMLESIFSEEDYYEGIFDNLHLGVLYMENQELDKALEYFKIQIKINKISEAYYYMAKTQMLLGNISEANENITTAIDLYEKNRKMSSYYYEYPDQIYRIDLTALNDKIKF
jgi:tetratricopeptide (TPR) repeat protein